MALFHDNKRGSQPSIHALLIGVGGYTQLPGDTTLQAKIHQQVGLLQKLNSPPRSALEFANWLKTSANWVQDLDTIDLLISPDPSDTAFKLPANVLPATMTNIQAAFSTWENRCDLDKDNIAIFYFSGHGLQKADHYLLAEDFGANPNNPYLGAIKFDETRDNFHKVKAQTQCFFVDACRQLTPVMLQYEPHGIVLTTRNWKAKDCLNDLTLKAAARYEQAFGPQLSNTAATFGANNALGISYFTQALIRSLDGSAAVREGKHWVIKTSEISAHINTVLQLIRKTSYQRCVVTANSTAKLRITGTPMVRIKVSCDPEIADPNAVIHCDGPLSPGTPVQHKNASPWKDVDVEAGTYQAQAVFSLNQYKHAMEHLMVGPPTHTALLECKLCPTSKSS